jgi:hypothetical protein
MDKQAQQLISSDIFQEIGLSHLPDGQKEQMLAQLIESVNNRVMIRVLDDLPEADQIDLKELLDRGAKDEEIRIYLEGKGVRLAELAAQEALVLKAELIAKSKELHKES